MKIFIHLKKWLKLGHFYCIKKGQFHSGNLGTFTPSCKKGGGHVGQMFRGPWHFYSFNFRNTCIEHKFMMKTFIMFIGTLINVLTILNFLKRLNLVIIFLQMYPRCLLTKVTVLDVDMAT